MAALEKSNSALKDRLHEIIFEADTPEGKLFDILLLVFILGSVIVVMLESVNSISENYQTLFFVLEWIFTIFFTIEYFTRLYITLRPIKYATSFFGVIDLLSILPAYFDLLFPGTHYLVVIRSLRLLRVFRIFKLLHFLKGGNEIVRGLKESRQKIIVFLFFILLVVTIMGSVLYIIEGNSNSGFTSIPRSIYWAIVTLTTVGYGDIAPVTEIGQFLAAVIMILGYAVIAVPTGIVTSSMMTGRKKKRKGKRKEEEEVSTQCCRHCAKEGHEMDAVYCKFCGEKLNEHH